MNKIKIQSKMIDGDNKPPVLKYELTLNTAAGFQAMYNALDCLELLDAKQLDYGPLNISSEGLLGLKTRLVDKIFRLKNLLENNREPNNESLADTFQDIVNYGLIGQQLIENTWPTTEEPQPRNIEILIRQ